jgi:hypothetical protein
LPEPRRFDGGGSIKLVNRLLEGLGQDLEPLQRQSWKAEVGSEGLLEDTECSNVNLRGVLDEAIQALRLVASGRPMRFRVRVKAGAGAASAVEAASPGSEVIQDISRARGGQRMGNTIHEQPQMLGDAAGVDRLRGA